MANEEKGTGEKLIRAFIAIDFPQEVIKEIARVQELLGKKKFAGKMTELENLHLTLKFLGEIDENKIKDVNKRLMKIKFEEMELKLGETGIFTSGKPRIVWIKVEGKEIWELQKKIDDSLIDLFKPEERFMSHLTIARVKYAQDKKGFENHVKNIKVKEIKFKVNKFKLLSSELKPLGPTYEIIEEFECE